MSSETSKPAVNFIRKIIDNDLASGKCQQLITRFPPEPNGYLHIGHAKSICLNFALAKDYQGQCHLRFDDTNPLNEEEEYMQAIESDIRWLGFDWGGHIYHASDYFEQLYQLALKLIQAGKAYVDSLSAEQMREYRGSLTSAGKPSPDRERSIEENLQLFAKMKAGEFAEGQYILRAKIDMAAGNMNLRDPAIYRIRNVEHHRSGDQWCIYPMYDFTHALSDAIEGITHSLCTLEFQDHRPLYEWFIEHCDMPKRPQQIEFSRLNLNYTLTSKRKLKQLVEGGYVSGWDDPRMATLRGMRRRGVPPEAIRNFCENVGISKQDSVIDMSVFDECIRQELNTHAPRRMAILQPIKVIIDNYPQDKSEMIQVANHPQQPELGKRPLHFGKEIYIDADDFMLDPPKKYFRLAPGAEVRLLNAYVIRCDQVLQDAAGHVTELHCHYDPDTLGGQKPKDGRKVKGVIHWLSARDALDAEVRVYDRLFKVENPGAEEDFLQCLNPDSLSTYHAKIEPELAAAKAEERFQFTRVGYFAADKADHSTTSPVFNRIVSLRETWK